ncbi:MAG: DNA-binding protein [Betaproteobacteria bacterium]|nr:DNA-binding protein [Betaproteobacteria bacterium]
MNRLFLDANVVFTAAHNPAGKAALLIELGDAGRWRLFTSSYALAEARHNLRLKYPERLSRLDDLARRMKIIDPKSGARCPLALPEKDRPIFLAAVACRATHLLTGDIKDFGPFMNRPKQTGGGVIQTVAEYLANL